MLVVSHLTLIFPDLHPLSCPNYPPSFKLQHQTKSNNLREKCLPSFDSWMKEINDSCPNFRKKSRSRILLSILGHCLFLFHQPQWLFFISNYTKMQDEDCYPEVPCISLMVWKFLLGKREQQQTEHIRALPSMIDSCAFASQPCQVCLPL